MDKALKGPDSNLFCRDSSSIQGKSIFCSVPLLISKIKISIKKKILMKLGSGNRSFRQVVVMRDNTQIEANVIHF